MSTNITFTPEQLSQSAALLPDLASTSAGMVELALDDHIHRESDYYPLYTHYDVDIVPPRPVIAFRRNEAEGRWEFFGRVKLLPYEMREAGQEGLDKWLQRKMGPRCAYLELGTPMGAIVPIMVFFRGSPVPVQVAERTSRTSYAGTRARPQVTAPSHGVLRPA